LNVLKSLW